MTWWLWSSLLAVVSVPIALLLADRLFAVPAARVIRVAGVPWVALFLALLTYGAAAGEDVVSLVAWGAVGGLLGTIALDAVRLAGLRAGAFPMDMPMMFGAISFGLAPRFQRAMLGQMVRWLATLTAEERVGVLRPRLRAIAALRPDLRRAVVGGMQVGLSRLPEQHRGQVLDSQVAVMTELEPAERMALMTAMDEATSGNGASVPYAQPRGLPKIPMAQFRQLAGRAFPETLAESGVSTMSVALAGYAWHVVNGVSFGVMYALLAGDGSWALALGWGVFVWLAMMVVMPPMMPAIRFPSWFPGVPLVAHLAMAVPIAWAAQTFITHHDAAASLLRHFQ